MAKITGTSTTGFSIGDEMTDKICSKPDCIHGGKPQPFSNFRKAKRYKDGHQAACKDCMKKTDSAYRGSDAHQQSQKRYLKSDKFKATRKKYVEENREAVNAYQLEWYHQNKVLKPKETHKKRSKKPFVMPTEKVCSRENCIHGGKPQPIENFRKAKKYRDGHQYACKDCMKQVDKNYRGSKAHKRSQDKYHKSDKFKATRKKYIEDNLETVKQYKLDWYYRNKDNPEYIPIMRARDAVNNAVKGGEIPPITSLDCIRCSKPAHHYHHHKGYDEAHQLDVVPVCRKCHVEMHDQ